MEGTTRPNHTAHEDTRQAQLNKVIHGISKGLNVIIIGSDGIGKSTFIRNAHNSTSTEGISIFISQMPIKQAVMLIAENIYERQGLHLPENILPPTTLKQARMKGFLKWNDIKFGISRLPIDKIVKIIQDSIIDSETPIILFVDSLPTAPSQLDVYKRLLPLCQLITTINTNKLRGDVLKFSYKLPCHVELKPLDIESSRVIIESEINKTPLNFSNDTTREKTLNHIANRAIGNPATMMSMIEKLKNHSTITDKTIKELDSEVGVHYFDMTPVLIIIILLFMAWRQISRGIGDTENYILSSLVLSICLILVYLWRASNRR